MRRRLTLATAVVAVLLASSTAERGFKTNTPKECPKIDSIHEPIHLAHEWDCTKFYKCDHGRRVLFECALMDSAGNRLHFDPVLQLCNWPNVVGCIPGERPSTPTGEGSSTLSTTGTTPTQQPTGVPSEPTLPSTGTPTQLTSSPTETSSQPTLPPTEIPTQPTPSPTETSSQPTNQSTTTATKPPQPPTESSTKSTQPPTEKTTQPTSLPSGTPSQSTASLTETTPSAGISKTSVETTTPSNPTDNDTTPVPTDQLDQNSTPIPSENFVPHENDCTKFYEIVDGKKIVKECARGLHFSSINKVCMLPSKAGCELSTTIRPTTSDPAGTESCGNIENNWVVPHECVCSKYYFCSNGDLILKECPDGMHFGKHIFGCTQPELADCESTTGSTTEPMTTVVIPTECPPDNSGPPVQLPHPTNCSLFYKCDNGKKKLLECPEDLHFNPVLQQCDWADSAGCEVSSTTITGGETITISTQPGTEYTTMRTSTVTIPTECPPNNEGNAVQLPHPYNCSLYYKCDNGIKVVQSCPRGLEFNAEEQICDWPESAGCVISTTETPWIWSTTTSSSPPTSSTEDTSRPPSSTTQDTSRPPSSTTQDTSRPPSSTTQNTTKPPSSTTQDTTNPSITTTEDTTRPPSLTTQDTTKSPSSTPDSSSLPSSTSTSQIPCVDGSKLAHEQNCSLYYECEDGENLIKECTAGLHFNPVLNICDWWEYAGCTVLTSPSTSSSTTSQTDSSEVTTDDYVGQDNSTSVSPTPSSTVQPTPSSTVPPTPSSTVQSTPSSTVPSTPSSTVPSTASSTVPSTPSSTEPPTPSSTAPPTPSSTAPPTPSSTAPPTPSSTAPPTPSSTVSSTLDSSESTSTTVHSTSEPGSPACIGNCPKTDPMSYTVLLPNEDCTKFCKCSNGRGYVYDCPAQLHFNPSKLVCDYPRNAECTGLGGWGQPKIEIIQASG